MKISIGCDHGGYTLKETIVSHLKDKGYEVEDCGCYSQDSVDYPVYGKAAAQLVAQGKADYGIVVCTTGIGMSIVANKIKGVRCALCTDTTCARLTKEHNNTNVLALGAGIVGSNLALEIVDTFLTTPFSNAERHAKRVAQITELEG